MKKLDYDYFPDGKWRKIFPFMKFKLVVLLCSVGMLSASPSLSQQKKLDVSYEKMSLVEVINDLKTITGYRFIYFKDAIPESAKVTMSIKGATIEQILDAALSVNGLQYSIDEDVIMISLRTVQQTQAVVAHQRVTGRVRDSDGRPLMGVSVTVKLPPAEARVTVGRQGAALYSPGRGIATDTDGKYSIMVARNETLAFSFVGKKTVEVKYTGQASIDVMMEEDAMVVESVVITGKFNRRLETETGSSVQFRGEQLLEAGNRNVLRSLASLDPSFIIMENLEFGSDPNTMPTIQMRGQSSFPNLQGEYSGNPNQPLFILDGFEVGVEKIFDLDMNRVSTITILKDASAKAIYGSKAGNGVVVIETTRMTPGKLRVTYSGALDVEAPDLTGYNLMNAKEKLAFELAVGAYKGSGQVEMNGGQNMMDGFYQALLREVEEGVDTDWLSQPLRTGIGHKHSLTIDGGDEVINYGIGLSYNNVVGVMKGSGRDTFSGNMSFGYYYKNLIFRNTLELTMNNAANSPYGNFSDYAKLNPYWRIHDDQGNLIPYYTIKHSLDKYPNPLYNASLNTKNVSEYTEIRNNFQLDWNILSNLKVTGRFNFSNRTGGSDIFYPANHTMFINYSAADSNRKGRYTKGDSKSTSYSADVGITYSKVMGRHVLTANGNWDMSSLRSTSHTYVAEGFGNDYADDIAFATQYLTGSTPSGFSNNQREAGVVGALNYSFDDRYLFDISGRTSGSSMFGADNKWGTFWSLGMGWNIHKEKFAQKAAWLDRFKIRGSIGYTGSQDFDPYQAKATYKYADSVYDGGYGAILMGLPNMRLLWQRVLDHNVGTDISILNRVSVKFDYYISITDDLLIDVALPPSVGFATYKENLGTVENKGFDISVSVTPWRDAEKRGWLTLTLSGMHNENKLKKIDETFTHRNNEQNAAKDKAQTLSTSNAESLANISLQYMRPSTLYYEGQSMTAIWGVRSAGINPVTGSELFYDRYGSIVPTWSSLDQVVIGDTFAKLRGNINMSAGYKGFTVSLACNYKFGGDIYNSTLVDKLEYASAAINFDRRVMQAWKTVGQVAPYKRLDSGTSAVSRNLTKPTSRFVMKDNELYVSSFNIGYDFQNQTWLRNAGLERLRLSFYMNELYRLSLIEIERGTSYPFARNFSFSLLATF